MTPEEIFTTILYIVITAITLSTFMLSVYYRFKRLTDKVLKYIEDGDLSTGEIMDLLEELKSLSTFFKGINFEKIVHLEE